MSNASVPGTQGMLLDHGPAPYQFKPEAEQSYFVKIGTAEGEKIVWGVDLPRALEESAVQPGDVINATNLGKQPVTVKRREYKDGVFVGMVDVAAMRNTWQIEPSDQAIEVVLAPAVPPLKSPADIADAAEKPVAEVTLTAGTTSPAPPPIQKTPGSWREAYEVREVNGTSEYHNKATKKLDLVDFGERVSVRGNAGIVAGLELAKEKGWSTIQMVSGPEWLQSMVWVEAAARGFSVEGYNPSEKDLKQMDLRKAKLEKEGVSTDKISPLPNTVEKDAVPTDTHPGSGKGTAEEQIRAARDSLNTQERDQKKRDGSSPARHVKETAQISPVEQNVLDVRNRLDEQEKQHAEELAKTPLMEKGQRSGRVAEIDSQFVYQEVGGGQMVKHRVDVLDRIPAKDEKVKIRYKEGKGHVESRERETKKEAIER